MAVGGLPLRPTLVCAARKSRSHSSAAGLVTIVDPQAGEGNNDQLSVSASSDEKSFECSGWPARKTVSSKELGITSSMIPKPVKSVLRGLREKGHHVYLVGGCVRDLVLKRTPKDFDVITSADLREVKKTFPWCDIVGRRFPICHVHVSDSVIEVSSFNTLGRSQGHGLTYMPRKEFDNLDYVRQRNCMRRDFTINGLMFDPYSHKIHDYLGGMEDIKKAKVRTVIPAQTSFQEDFARTLRAIRIAARLGFQISRETAQALKDQASSILSLDKGRILMEMNYMLAYGSSEASFRLLWKLGFLEILLPIQAAYFVSQGFRRRDKRSNMLLGLFSNLDRLLAPNRPCDSSLWVGILAFHQALVREPRDPLVIAAFALSLHNGGDISEAISIARRITIPHGRFSELLEPFEYDSDQELTEAVLRLVSSLRAALRDITDELVVSKAMAKYPQAPFSDLVFIPMNLYSKVLCIVHCISKLGRENFALRKQGSKIDYQSLAQGCLTEVRHVFARVVFDTVYPPNLGNTEI